MMRGIAANYHSGVKLRYKKMSLFRAFLPAEKPAIIWIPFFIQVDGNSRLFITVRMPVNLTQLIPLVILNRVKHFTGF
jgi:hypothetical protein